jgi:hypothetical protein
VRRAFVLLTLLAAACKTAPVTLSAPEPSANEQRSLTCKSPRFDPAATCETTLASFYADMANACDEAQPALAKAMRDVEHDVLIQPPPEGSSGWRRIDRKSFTLYQASWALLPRECTTDFMAARFPGDDYGRSVCDVSRLWRTDAQCRPDEDLFATRGNAQGSIDVGVWSFAMALAPHLTPAGKVYLRKLLVCEERAYPCGNGLPTDYVVPD